MHIRIIAALVLLVACALAATPVAAQSTSDAPLVVEQLECRGNATTSCAYILSYLYLSPGSEVDEEEIRNAKFRLSALPNFTSVRIFLEKGSARGRANLIVEVVEANPLFAETLAGVANHRANQLGLRIGHQNLFGAGERLELTASARFPVDGPIERESEQLRLQYVDPTLFDSQRYFFTAGAGHFRNRVESRFDDFSDLHETGVDFQVGRRIADFSYLAVGYRYLFTGSYDSRFLKFDGSVEEATAIEYRNQFLLDYGWNSEDDPYFPTRGGRLRASFALALTDSRLVNGEEFEPERWYRWGAGYRHTWTFAARNYVHVQYGVAPDAESRSTLDDENGFTLGYERALPANGLFSGIERGRWYVHVKDFHFGVNDGYQVKESGLRVGIRLDTRQYGIVELYLQATTER